MAHSRKIFRGLLVHGGVSLAAALCRRRSAWKHRSKMEAGSSCQFDLGGLQRVLVGAFVVAATGALRWGWGLAGLPEPGQSLGVVRGVGHGPESGHHSEVFGG